MQGLRQIFKFYLDASIHVAFGVVSLYFVSVEMFEVSTNRNLAIFLFFGTIVCYNFMKFGVEAEKYLIVANPYHKLIQGFSFLSFGFAAYFFFQLETRIWFSILGLIVFSILYAIPLLPKAKNLRSFAGLKTFFVALVWMGCTVFLLVVDNKLDITWDVLIVMTQRFLLVLILLLPFEIRDMKFDKPELRTLPQRIGVAKTKRIGYFLVVFYIALEFLKDETSYKFIGIKLLLGMVLLFVLKKTNKNQTSYFSSFWVESISMLYLGLFFVATKIS